jgi:DNA mismatch endonuclease (patch repair protein)
MADVVDKATRSRMMSGIRGRDTKPELMLRRELHRRGFRFRLHVRNLPGKPDIVLPRYRAVVLVHGCFWHGHDCRYFRYPATRPDFWRKKIASNRQSDARVVEALGADGWRVAVVWECATRVPARSFNKLADSLGKWIRGNRRRREFRE